MEFTAAATWLNTAFAGFDNFILEFMHTLEEAAGGIITPLASFITLIGEKGLLMFALAFVLMLFANTRKLGICLFGAVCCGALITNIILKDLIARPRPFEAMAPFLKYWKAVGSPPEDGFSFPSGHVTAAAAGVAAIIFVKGKKFILPGALYVFLMCFSRNYLMAHYPSDVLAASIVGLFSGLVAYLIGSFIWEYIDDNDDLPFFRTLRHFSLPLPKLKKSETESGRSRRGSAEKKSSRKGAKAAASTRSEKSRGRHSSGEAQGRHSSGRRAAAPPPQDYEFDLEEDIELALENDLEQDVTLELDDEEDAYDLLVSRASDKESTGSRRAVRTGRTGSHEAVSRPSRSSERTGSHEAVSKGRSGRMEAFSGRTGSHEAVSSPDAERTGSRKAATGRHSAVPAKEKTEAKIKAPDFGKILGGAKAKLPKIKTPAAINWRAQQSAAEKEAPSQAPAVSSPEAAPAPKARPTSDWNARWEEYQARKQQAQVKTAPAAPGSVQMEFETRFAPVEGDEDVKIAPVEGDEDVKIAPARPAKVLSAAEAVPSEAPAEAAAAPAPAETPAEDTVNDAVVKSSTGTLEVPAEIPPVEEQAEKPLSPQKPEETEAAVAEDNEALTPPAQKSAPPESVKLDMSEFYSLLDGSYDFGRD